MLGGAGGSGVLDGGVHRFGQAAGGRGTGHPGGHSPGHLIPRWRSRPDLAEPSQPDLQAARPGPDRRRHACLAHGEAPGRRSHPPNPHRRPRGFHALLRRRAAGILRDHTHAADVIRRQRQASRSGCARTSSITGGKPCPPPLTYTRARQYGCRQPQRAGCSSPRPSTGAPTEQCGTSGGYFSEISSVRWAPMAADSTATLVRASGENAALRTLRTLPPT